jgi:hypothetical protein
MTKLRAAAIAHSNRRTEMTDYEKTWLRGAEGEMLTLTVYVPRAECIEAWQFFNETVLEFLAHRQIPYEINMTDRYGELDRGGSAHIGGEDR